MTDRSLERESRARVLERLMALLMQPAKLPRWEALPREMQQGLRAACFLLDVQAGRDAETLVLHVLPRLERQLHHRTERVREERRERVRGAISWAGTYRARAGAQGDPTLYVCRETRHEYDTPENQLLRLMVDRLEACRAAVPAPLRGGTSWEGGAVPRSTPLRLERLRAALAGFRANPRLREVTLPHRATELQLRRAEASRMREYAEVRRLYARYEAVVLAADPWPELVAVARRVLLLPAAEGPEAEPWLQVGAALLRG